MIDRERQIRDAVDVLEDTAEELSYLAVSLDEELHEDGIVLEWPPDLEGAARQLYQLRMTIEEVTYNLSRLASELRNEALAAAYPPEARALGNGGLSEPGRRSQ